MAEAGDSSKMHYSDYTSWIPIMGPAIMGRRQKRLAAQINPIRPTYQIPGEINANVNMYNSMAGSSRLPAQSLMEDNLKASTASTFNQAQNAAGGSGGSAMLAAMGRVNQNESNSVNQLNIAGAENQQANKDKLAQSRNTMADYKQQEFDYNQNQPYELALMKKRALVGAAMGNYDAGRKENQELGLALLGSGGKGGGGCFDADTIVQMEDGATKYIGEVETGDQVLHGGNVIATMQFGFEKLYNYCDVFITGYHAVCENGNWVRVMDSKLAKETTIVKPVYNLITQHHKIVVNNILFADYLEVDIDDKTLTESLVALNCSPL